MGFEVMKKFALAFCFSWTLLVGPASAQLFNWTGFYVGGSAGYQKHYTKWHDDGGWLIVDDVYKKSVDGAIFGLLAGQNFQSGVWVFGYEADINYSTASGTFEWIDPVKMDARLLATARLRGGVVQDQNLFFVTGGLAYGNAKTEIVQSPSWIEDSWKLGWVAGGGWERALNQNWSIRLEALWVQFSTKNFRDGVPSYPMRVENSDLIVRVALNLRRP